MTTLTHTSGNSKQRLSLLLDSDKKQALEQIAKQQNRSLNGVVGDTIDRALNAMQEEAEYPAYIQNRVTQAYNQMIENGSHGIDSSELKKRVMHNLNNRLQNRE